MGQALTGEKPKTPRLWFADFWHDETPDAIRGNFLYQLLARRFDVVLAPQDPEFLVYSYFGQRHYRFRCTKIFYVGESILPNFKECDWAFSFAPTGGRNFRLPLWALQMGDPTRLLDPVPDPQQLLRDKERFCAFVYSNPTCEYRNRFFKVLSSRKAVDAAGRLFNNTSGLSGRQSPTAFEDLPVFYSKYKFVVAFENVSAPGYITEKIITPFLGGAVPIYWGNPEVASEFNAEAFINAHDFATQEELADFVLRVDADDDLYLKYLAAPKLRDGRLPDDCDWATVASRFGHIFDTPVAPVSGREFANRHMFPRLPEFVLRKVRRYRTKRLRM